MSSRIRVNALAALLLTLIFWGSAPPDSPVADAAMQGETEQVRVLLRDGADVNAAQGDGMTALHWAAERGDRELADMLLYAGAHLESVTRLGGYTPLHLASRSGRSSVVEALTAAGANADAKTTTGGVTALHFAAAAATPTSISVLIDHGADVDAREDAWGQTPLMFAAAAGRVGAVKVLLRQGANTAITARVMNMEARDAADRADQQRSDWMADALRAVEEGRPLPEPIPDTGPDPIESPFVPQDSPGEQTQEANRQRTVSNLVSSSRLSHAQLVGGYGGLTALLLASRGGLVATTEALLDGGADINQVSLGDHTSPLLMSTINGHFDLAMLLLERGADPNLSSDAGATPLYTTLNTEWIPKSRHPQPANRLQQEVAYMDLVKALLDAGADTNIRLNKQLWYTTFGVDYLRIDRMGATPFWRAAYALDLEAMKLLVAHGADPDIPTIKPASRSGNSSSGPDPSGLPAIPDGGPGAWPIHAASGVGYGEGYAANIHRTVPDNWLPTIRYLVEELGADVNARDHNGYTAVHHAAARGDNEMILYLVDKGADVMGISRRGQTTVDMANGPVERITPFPETIALLESLGAVNNHNCVIC